LSPNKKIHLDFFSPKGRSGGLLVGFNTDVFEIISHDVSEFMINCLILQKFKNISWNFINVYGAS
jgi:hypothetical protein